ncbi:beta-lactamase family protein [Nocardioides humilatus]|uniref:Beta-lactamase family protein n=2 Tax=Nocardioides humilatus TaxID=2607660 RepID=A0A5B1L5S6_9ACTN|nr:beta-lactamase family protein [Nocardioides humilatus]
MTRDGVERIWKDARTLYRSGIHPALTLCVRRHGEVVLDRAIGHARGNGPKDGPDTEKVLATPETPMCMFSATKGITAALIHLLDERGVLHVGDRIAEYLPEFARNGKSGITIAQVLSHRAGIPNLPAGSLDLDRMDDWEFQRELFYDATPIHRPGKRQAYHAVSGGNLLGEVVREVTGKGIRDVLAEGILDPLGFRWTNYGVAAEDVDKVALNYPTGPVLLPPMSTMLTRALGLPPDEATVLSNEPRFLTAVAPAANGVTTANELSRFYELLRNGGELDGVRIMDPRTIRRATVEQSHLEVDLSLGLPIGFSMGFMLGGRRVSLFGGDTAGAFGHLGWINILSWTDPARAISVAMITTGKAALYPEVTRFLQIPRRIGMEASKIQDN